MKAIDVPSRDTSRLSTRRQSRMAVDSAWILLGYAVTSGTGFVFWILAARLLSPESLGVQTAVYSLVTAAAAIAASGVGDALLVMLPVSGSSRRILIRRGLTLVIGLGLCAGLIAGCLAAALIPTGLPGPLVFTTVAVGTVVWAIFVAKDPILQALGRASWSTALNAPMNVIKLALLPILVLTSTIGGQMLWAIAVPVIVVVAISYVRLVPRALNTHEDDQQRGGSREWYRENSATFLVFSARAGATGGLYLGIGLSLPFLVTALAGPAQGATFALCFQFALVLDLVALAVGTSFSTHSSGTQGGGSTGLLGVWLRVLGVVAVGAIGLVALSPVILAIAGHSYVSGGGVLLIATLSLAAVIRTSYEMWGASLRARLRTTALLVCSAAQAVALLALVFLVVPTYGALGAGFVLLAVTTGLSVVGVIGIVRAHNGATA